MPSFSVFDLDFLPTALFGGAGFSRLGRSWRGSKRAAAAALRLAALSNFNAFICSGVRVSPVDAAGWFWVAGAPS